MTKILTNKDFLDFCDFHFFILEKYFNDRKFQSMFCLDGNEYSYSFTGEERSIRYQKPFLFIKIIWKKPNTSKKIEFTPNELKMDDLISYSYFFKEIDVIYSASSMENETGSFSCVIAIKESDFDSLFNKKLEWYNQLLLN